MIIKYAGVGSRKTPYKILKLIQKIAKELAKIDYVLRSGGASGADDFFERGCDLGFGKKEIFLPAKGFNDNKSELYNIPEEAYIIAERYHKYFKSMKPYVKSLMARNVQQVLGKDLNDKSHFILCWTPDGADGYNIKTSDITGGTGQAIRIAHAYNIPVHNLKNEKIYNNWKNWIDAMIKL